LTTPRDRARPALASKLSRPLGFLSLWLAVLTPNMTETAVANGDTRTIYLHHAHTGEDIAATYLVNGQYDSNVLRQLNWFLRDWRRDEPTNMDPRLFDVVWEAYRGAGAGNQVINVVSAYRSPETNAMLRARSRAVAKYSQHMLGKAMDTTMPGMPMSHIREIGMRMQRGGVGYYPNAGTPFVHLDVGNVRSWPRMSYDQLVRLFPDGKTVHLPTNGQPLARYEEARAEIEARGNGAYVTAPRRSTFGGFLASLFGGGGEEEDAEIAAPAPSTRKQWAALAPRRGRGAAADSEEGGAETEQPTGRYARAQLARAEADLPRGETAMTATGAVAVAPPQAAEPDQAQEPPQEEENRRGRNVRAPLPPARRPASIDKPAPLDTKPTETASLDAGANGLRGPVDAQQDESPAPGRIFANVPAPPRRPTGLAALAAATVAPSPPQRPQALGPDAAHAIANLVDAHAPRAGGKEETPLAYASPPGEKDKSAEPRKPAAGGARQAEVVPARLDRSNFNALTAATPASRTTTRSVMGAPIGAVRSAARAAEPSVLAPANRPAHVVGFAAPDVAPPTDRFAPGAARGRSADQKNEAISKK
jgi:uncharacterized protein YcbK (DUF882 family)